MNVTQKLSIVGISLGLLSMGYSFYNQKRIEKTLIDKISNGITLDISDAIVNEAVNVVVEREATKAVKDISMEISLNTRMDIRNAIKSEVDSARSKITSSVSDEIATQAANIDMRKLKEEVKDKAKGIIIEKFDDNLDSLLADFNDKLSNVSKIYSSIADSMTRKKESETILRIGI